MLKEKILVVQTAFIGDAILTLPMLQKLKEMYDGCEIGVVAIPSTAEIFHASPVVNEVRILDKRDRHKSLKNFIEFCREIKKGGYTRIYSPHRSYRSAILVLLSGIKESYGFTRNSLRHFYKYLINYNDTDHEVKRNLDLIGFNTVEEDWKILPELQEDVSIKQKVNSFFERINTLNIVALAPGSIWNTKKYPKEHFEKIISWLADTGYFVLVLGGKNDQELCSELAAGAGERALSIAGRFSLVESIEILRRCKALICNDSAPTHMAMCADIPVITLYCSTVPDFGFYPYNKKSIYLSFNDLYCKPCGIHGYRECPVKTFDCGYKLDPGNVVPKIKEILNGNT